MYFVYAMREIRSSHLDNFSYNNEVFYERMENNLLK